MSSLRQPGSRTATPVHVPVGKASLNGTLVVPANASGIVLFAHGSGSGRHSPRNQYVARQLEAAGVATLLIDLLTEPEEAIDARTAHLRFDIDLLAARVIAVVDWLAVQPATTSLKVGVFGASTGAAAALVAAAERPRAVAAVVSRGGRPDLAGGALPRVSAPTLLIVGGDDAAVIEMNRDAMARMSAQVALHIVPGATHLFEEPGTLEDVATHAAAWFTDHMRVDGGRRRSDDTVSQEVDQ